MSDTAPRKAPRGKAAPAAAEHATVEQAEAEQAAVEHAAAEQAEAQSADDQAKPDLDEVKRKFRAALDRKRERGGDGAGDSGRGAGKIQGAHGPAAGRRSFRRKSG
jgi:hypothetical protein